MKDIYLCENTNVLKTRLGIHDGDTLKVAEAELLWDNMITFGEYPEYEHLEKILMKVIRDTPQTAKIRGALC